MNYNAVLDVVFVDDTPVNEPVSVQQVKDHLRIDLADDDALIGIYIKAARGLCEGFTNISFIKRTVTAQIINSVGNVLLPYGPVRNIITASTGSSAGTIAAILSRYQYTGTGGETTISSFKDISGNVISLVGKKVVSFEKDGISYSKQITSGTPVDKQFLFNSSTGSIEISIPFEPGEEAWGFYLDEITAGVDAGTTLDGLEIPPGDFRRIKTASCEEITIAYEAGYQVLPDHFTVALLCQVAWLYENRGDAELKNGLCEQAKLLLAPYRRVI